MKYSHVEKVLTSEIIRVVDFENDEIKRHQVRARLL